ncbi:sporulation protein YabP [Brassicibacter mesophilus]|uniref:sporulation protein YabP n=1 Tax=Brassicibacter mesophilus TaxID=745119 RepID=UPI003D1A578A
MNDNKGIGKSQNIILENREKLSISGVEHVDSFNDNTIVLATLRGGMIVKGASLNISKLNLEDGNVIIEGNINSVVYNNKDLSGTKGNGLLGKMFK